LACAAFENRDKNFVLLCFWLGVAANTHLIFTVVAFSVFVLWMLDFYIEKRVWQKKTTLGCMIFAAALILAICQIIPPDDTHFFTRVNQMAVTEKFTKGFISFFKGLVALPDYWADGIHFWNSNLLVNRSRAIAGFLGLLAYGLPLILFYRNIKILLFTYAALFGVQLFFFVTQMSATRYDGITYIILIAALWLELSLATQRSGWTAPRPRNYLDILKNPVIYGILALHFCSGLYAWYSDVKHPFSGSRQAVQYLKDNHLLDQPIISAGCEGTSISAYVQRKVWFLCNEKLESFCRWNAGCSNSIDQDNLPYLLDDLDEFSHAVAVLNDSIPTISQRGSWIVIGNHTKIKFHIAFNNNVVRQSNYYIYEISKTD